jgi:hypothetical protein
LSHTHTHTQTHSFSDKTFSSAAARKKKDGEMGEIDDLVLFSPDYLLLVSRGVAYNTLSKI